MKKIGLILISLALLAGLLPVHVSAEESLLNLATASNTPSSQDVVVGTPDKVVLSANFTAGPYDIRTDNLSVKAFTSNNGTISPLLDATLSNVRLYTDHTAIASATFINGVARFTDVNWRILAGMSKTLDVMVDVSDAQTKNFFIVIEAKDVVATVINTGARVSVSGSANGTLMVIKESGSLSVSLSPDSPQKRIVAVGNGTANITLAKYDFTAGPAEAVLFDVIPIKMESDRGSLVNLSLWEGETQVGQTLAAPTANALFGVNWRVDAGTTKTLTIKADASSIFSSGATENLGIDTSAISAFGEFSLHTITVEPQIIMGNEIVLRKSKPYIAASSLPSTVLTAGENTLYRWTVTADAKGDIAWNATKFQIAGGVISAISDPSERLQFIASLKVTLLDGQQIAGNWQGPWAGDIATLDFTALSDQAVAANQTRTYELRATILKLEGDAISTKIPVSDDGSSFRWTDGVAWATDYLIPGIPTAAMSLTNNNPPAPSPLRGDVNGDGKVNALDITALERIIAGLD